MNINIPFNYYVNDEEFDNADTRIENLIDEHGEHHIDIPFDRITIRDDEITDLVQYYIHKICRSNYSLMNTFNLLYMDFHGYYIKYPIDDDKFGLTIVLSLHNRIIDDRVDNFIIDDEIYISSYQEELFSQFEEHVADDSDSDSDGGLITITYTDSDSEEEEEEEDQPLREL